MRFTNVSPVRKHSPEGIWEEMERRKDKEAGTSLQMVDSADQDKANTVSVSTQS